MKNNKNINFDMFLAETKNIFQINNIEIDNITMINNGNIGNDLQTYKNDLQTCKIDLQTCKIDFANIIINNEIRLNGVFSFSKCHIDIEMGFNVDLCFDNSKEIFIILEILRKKNDSNKLGSLYINYEKKRIECNIIQKIRNINDNYFTIETFKNVVPVIFSTCFFLFKNNSNFFKHITNPVIIPRLEFDDSIYDNSVNHVVIITADLNLKKKIENIKKTIEKHYTNNVKNDKVVKMIEISENIDKPIKIGSGGFSVAYARQIKYQILYKTKKHKTSKPVYKISNLVYKTSKQNVKNSSDKYESLKLDKNSKQINKQYSKQKNKNDFDIIKKLSVIKSKNIIKHYIDKSKIDKDVNVYYEKCNYGDLRNFLSNTNIITATTKLLIAIGIAEGIETLHKNNIVHKDIKSINVFIADGIIPKIADFGESFIFISNNDSDPSGFKELNFIPSGSTPFYSPPEMDTDLDSKYMPPIDIYAFGLVLAELFFDITPKTINYGTKMSKTMQCMKITEKLWYIKQKKLLSTIYETNIIKIIENCLSGNPNNRWNMSYIKSKLQYILSYYMSIKTI